jgi:hypothetical protein
MSKSTLAVALFAPFCLITAACGNIDAGDDHQTGEHIGAAQEAFSASAACEKEVYYFTVEGDDEAAALAACKGVCDGDICSNWKNDAVASIQGNAGDDDTWKCDCTCECDDDRGDKRNKATAQTRDN